MDDVLIPFLVRCDVVCCVRWCCAFDVVIVLCFFFCSESGSSELRMLSDLSPGSRKRTGRAYVALARAQSEKYVFGFCFSLLLRNVVLIDALLHFST